jgi:acetylornithine/succinyldiaminopimelate/putrescine aminotransferase
LAVAAGSDRFAKIFLADTREDYNVKVPFNDIRAMEEALSKNDAACVIMETIPATYGFRCPRKATCRLSRPFVKNTEPFISPMRCRRA